MGGCGVIKTKIRSALGKAPNLRAAQGDALDVLPRAGTVRFFVRGTYLFHQGDPSFFFSSRRRHTRYIGDWSSDVCSSDLLVPAVVRVDRLDGSCCVVERFERKQS